MDKVIILGKEIPVSIVYKNIRHTYLRVKPNQSLLITTSKRTKVDTIESFIKANESKIFKAIDKNSEPLMPLISHEIMLFGTFYPTIYNPSLKKSLIFENHTFFYNSENTKLIALQRFYARSVIQKSYELIEKWREILSKDIDLSNLVIKSRWMKSQFGSCQNVKKIINMNSVLARFDIVYLETILIHELVHLKIQNHGSDFYHYLNKYLPNYRSTRKELGHLFKRIEV